MTVYRLHLDSWYGRLGNNLTQLSNGIYYAEKTNSLFSYVAHPIIENKAFDFSNISTLEKITSNFWQVDVERAEMEENRSRVLRKYIFPLLPYKKIEVPYDLVVHIRGGDIVSPSPQPGYVQSPLSYFLKIFSIENPETILLVCEDNKNLMVNELLNSRYNCTYQSGTIVEDMNYLLNSKKIIFGGVGTFSPNLALSSPNVERVYYPLYENCYSANIGCHGDFEVIECSHRNYIRGGEWKYDHQQQQLMRSHKIEDIHILAESAQNSVK